MFWKIFYLISVIVCIKAWPQCAEFRFGNTDNDLNTDEMQLKGRIPKLFESYDCGNYSGVERTLKSLQSLRLPSKTYERQQSSTLKTVS